MSVAPFVLAVAQLTLAAVLLNAACYLFDPKRGLECKGFTRDKYLSSVAWQALVLPICLGVLAQGLIPRTAPTTALDFAAAGRPSFEVQYLGR